MSTKTRLEKLNEIIIDPEFEGMCENLTDEEYNKLRDNILNDGEVIDPLLLWNGVLIDGHNRLKILKEHSDIPYKTYPMVFDDRDEALAWIADHQLGRRNLTAFQKTQLALKKEPYIAKKAKANQKAAGGAVPKKSAKAVDTRKEIAEIAGVSTDTVSKVKKILEKGSPELIEDARSGKVSVNKAYNSITEEKAKPPKADTTFIPSGKFFKAPPESQTIFSELANASFIKLGSVAHLCRDLTKIDESDEQLKSICSTAEGIIADTIWYFHFMYGVPIEGLEVYRNTVEFTDDYNEIYNRIMEKYPQAG